MRIVVAGGTGFLGTALVERLRADAHEVTVLSRNPRQRDEVLWEARPARAPWWETIDGADGVVNLAGVPLDSGRWTDDRKSAIRGSRIDATHALATAIAHARRPPAVLLNASAVGFYGPRGDEVLTETSAPGSGFLASVCQCWEQEAMTVAGTSRVVLLRTGLVLHRSGGALPRIAMPFHFWVGGPVGSGRQYWSWVHRDDWVEMARWALELPAVAGPLNITAPRPVTSREFARTLGGVLRRPAALPVPAFPLRVALGEMADATVLTGQRVVPEKAASLGFRFRFSDLEAALRAIY